MWSVLGIMDPSRAPVVVAARNVAAETLEMLQPPFFFGKALALERDEKHRFGTDRTKYIWSKNVQNTWG